MTAIRASSTFWAALAATFLAGCAEPPATYVSEAEKRPAATTGCIGETLENCVDSVKRFIPVDSDGSGPDFSPDIQGKVPTSGRANFDSANFFDPNAIGQITYAFFAEFGANQRIKSLSISISNGFVALARTEGDYNGTGIYEAVAGVAKGACPMSKAEFYKMFDANTRGKLNYRTEFETLHYTLKDLIGRAKPMVACGLHIKFSTHAMEGADLVSTHNLSGTDVFTSLDIN